MRESFWRACFLLPQKVDVLFLNLSFVELNHLLFQCRDERLELRGVWGSVLENHNQEPDCKFRVLTDILNLMLAPLPLIVYLLIATPTQVLVAAVAVLSCLLILTLLAKIVGLEYMLLSTKVSSGAG